MTVEERGKCAEILFELRADILGELMDREILRERAIEAFNEAFEKLWLVREGSCETWDFSNKVKP